MATTQPQIAHEAEVHRQHVRLKIPVEVEIDETRYQVDDWSMGGFGVQGDTIPRTPGETFIAKLLFPFDGFEMAMLLDCELVYVVETPRRFGCRFRELDHEQVALFRYLVDAFLSGEVVSAGDIIQIRARDNRHAARQTLVHDPVGTGPSFVGRLGRVLGMALLALLGVGLASLIYVSARDSLFGSDMVTARVTATSYDLRAPRDGTVHRLAAAETVTTGEPVAEIVTADAGSALILSPCECFIHEWTGPEGDYRAAGEPIVTLVASDSPLVVEAFVPVERALGLREGDSAEIRFLGREGVVPAAVATIQAEGAAASGTGGAQEVVVTLRPQQPVPFEQLGSLVTVRFDG